jgi:uncharacterized protein YeaO (DUF488 family)
VPLRLKRVYEKPSPADGKRILVKRLWPRGLRKDQAQIDLWLKDAAPSAELRKWYGHDAGKWKEFKARYWKELEAKRDVVADLAVECKANMVTFVFGSKEETLNSAAALKEYIETRLE